MIARPSARRDTVCGGCNALCGTAPADCQYAAAGRVDVPGVVGLPVTTIALTSNTAWYLYNFRGGIIRALIERGFGVVTIAPEDEFSRRLLALGCAVLNIRMDN